MRINVAVPEAHVTAPVLDAALESVTRLNEDMLKSDQIPTFETGLKYGVKWKPEPPGAEHFDHAATVLRRKWGDCDDLAPWHAASLRNSGEDPAAKAIVKRSGPKTWHAVVLRGDGSIDDPSRRAGMGQRTHGVIGATLPLMYAPPSGVHGAYAVRPQIALRPTPRGWQARADIPWHHHEDGKPTATDYAMASLHTAPVASTALTGAIEGAVELGIVVGFAAPDHLDRLCAIHGVLCGHDFRDVAEVFGEEEAYAAQQVVGSFFSGLKKMVSKAVSPLTNNPLTKLVTHNPLTQFALHNPLTNMAASFVPGGAAALEFARGGFDPMAMLNPQSLMRAASSFVPGGSAAFNMASQMMPGGGGGGGGFPGFPGGGFPFPMPFG